MAESIAALVQRAQAAVLEERYQDAHKLCMAALAQDAATHRAFYVLAQIPAAHQNPGKALEIVERALRTGGQRPEYLALAAQQYLALNQQSQARATAQSALEAGPTDAHTLDTIGVVFSRTGVHERAVSCFEQAVPLAPDNASYVYNLASSRQFLGQFDAARAGYERVIALQPDHYRAHSALSQLDTQSADQNHIPRLLAAFEMQSDDVDGALHIGHALAKEYEDLQEYDSALMWLERAKAGKRAQLAHRLEDDLELFAAARETLREVADSPSSSLVETPSAGSPIFVVGMPRSGTTLVDRILSSHSQVTSVGELTQFALLTKRKLGTRSNLVLDAATLTAALGTSLDSVGGDYRRYAQDLAGTGQRPLDKMPLNFFYVPLILRAMPDARIIVLRRNPMDTCLSNYRQLFATSFSYYRYAYDLNHTARYFAAFAELMDAYREQLHKAQLCEVHYEDLVADLVPQAQRLVDFCGLEWEAACAAFHRNTAPVATASSVQVRQPLYGRASGRWKRYGEALRALQQVLIEQGIVIE